MQSAIKGKKTRPKRLHIPVSDKMHQEVETAAIDMGINMAEFVRRAIVRVLQFRREHGKQMQLW